MSEKTNPQTEFAALTDEELEQVNAAGLNPATRRARVSIENFAFTVTKSIRWLITVFAWTVIEYGITFNEGGVTGAGEWRLQGYTRSTTSAKFPSGHMLWKTLHRRLDGV